MSRAGHRVSDTATSFACLTPNLACLSSASAKKAVKNGEDGMPLAALDANALLQLEEPCLK